MCLLATFSTLNEQQLPEFFGAEAMTVQGGITALYMYGQDGLLSISRPEAS